MIPPLLSLLLFALLEFVVWERLVPPPVRPATAPAELFSAARARQSLERLLSEGEPHPAGSAAQERVRARLLAELEQLGLKPEVQTGVACSPEGVCAELHNVLAELPGSGGAPSTTLVSAHYDSVNSGPGAGDDGQGVATLLELARALRSAPAASGSWLLFSDGEELGLLGARLFAAEHPLMAQLRVSLNLEARGNRGPSLMFQTGEHSGDLVRRYGRSPRPVASSLFTPVYRALPNDTDFSIFLRKGLEGLNLAFVGGVASYHTPNDTVEALDWRSVQQQGDAALTTLRGLDAPSEPDAQPVYFDLLTSALVRLPEGLMLPLALLGLGCFGAALWRERLRDHGRAVLALLLGWGVPLLGTALLGTALTLLGALPFPVVATPQPFLLSILLLIALGQALALGVCRSPEQRRALADVTWLCWLVPGTALALVLPAASYLLVLPGFVAGTLRFVQQLRGGAPPRDAVQLGAALFSGLLVLPVLTLLPATLELAAPVVLALAWALGLSPLAPLLAGLLAPARREQRVRIGLFVGVFALAAVQLALPAYSSEVPQRLSLVLE
ncbi:MAG TPA: M28 family peptidase, partial [Polyangiaceae bacterium]|nr:M28 family peptidase [Polyangiaceae bacterium]